MKQRFFLIALAFLLGSSNIVFAKDYPANFFGINGNSNTLNTRSIQFGIDYISDHGGGRLVFDAGVYLTGTIHLKSGVTLQLDEGATLLGSTNPFDYDRQNTPFDNGRKTSLTLISGLNQNDIGITGKGIIDGQGKALVANISDMIKNGLIKDPSVTRPGEDNRPMIIHLYRCDSVVVRNVLLKNSACWVECYNQCKDVTVDSISVNSKAFSNNDGIDIEDCENFTLTNSSFSTDDDCVCLKSMDPSLSDQNILIENNSMHYGANGVKIGTASHGAFRNIKILNNKVFDSYRSAIALEAVDGGVIENVEVNNLVATGVGNGIFIRLGERQTNKESTVKNVTISNVSINIGIKKGWENGSAPAILIAGLPGQFVSGVTLDHISINTLGAADADSYKMLAKNLTEVPENPKVYPEYDMFGELPSWGIYIRHAKDIKFNNVSITSTKKDFRNAVVLDDVHDCIFKEMKIAGPEAKKKPFVYQSSNIKF
ncbi:MAG: glycosyl hydrolase family 28 protein [Ginsengibacter sp.]